MELDDLDSWTRPDGTLTADDDALLATRCPVGAHADGHAVETHQD